MCGVPFRAKSQAGARSKPGSVEGGGATRRFSELRAATTGASLITNSIVEVPSYKYRFEGFRVCLVLMLAVLGFAFEATATGDPKTPCQGIWDGLC